MKTTSRQPSVYLVVPVFNGIEHTRSFLKSMKDIDYEKAKVIIVDDGSTDGTSEMIAKDFPDAVILKGDGNLWWSGATNRGVEYALAHKADYVLTINNDVTMPKDYLTALVAFAQQHPLSIVGSLITSLKDNSVWYAGAFLNNKTGDLQHYQTAIDEDSGYRESGWLTGMGVLVPVRAFQDVGLFDEKNFPLYFGDADFSMRANKSGWELLVTNSTTLVADTSASWLSRQLSKPTLGFYYSVLFSIRSNYNLPDRIKFYRRHWPQRWRLALARFYIVFFIPQMIVFTKQLIKKYLGRGL